MEVFPTELTRIVIRYVSDKRTLATIARCSSKYRSLAESIIYYSLHTTKNLLPRQASHFVQLPHLAQYLMVLRVQDDEWSSQTLEATAARSVKKILELAVNLEEMYYPSSSNGSHGDVFTNARCYNIRILRCHFRDAEKEICDFVVRCLNLEDLELTPSFGEYHNARVARGQSGAQAGPERLILPLERHQHLRRLSVPVVHLMGVRHGARLATYVDESESPFGWDHLFHLAKVTGHNLRSLDVENLPEQTSFLYMIPELFPNLRLLATPSVFTVVPHYPYTIHQIDNDSLTGHDVRTSALDNPQRRPP